VILKPFQPFRMDLGKSVDAIEIQLQLEQLRHKVTVRETHPLLDPHSSANLDVVILDKETLAALPALNDDLVAVISRYVDPDATGSGGVSLVVDGMETNKVGVTASAIQEVRINQNPYSAEFSSPGRARVEVITKQETDQFHGELRVRARNSALDARNAFALTRPPQRRLALEGHLTGPIGSGRKTSFLVSGETDREDEQALIYARTPSGLHQEIFPQPKRDNELSVRLNHRPGEQTQFSARYELEKESAQGAGAGGFTLPEASQGDLRQEHSVYWKHLHFLSPRLMNEVQGRIRFSSEQTISRQPGQARIVVEDAFTGGGAQADSRDTRGGLEAAQAFSYSGGRHFLRAGAALRELSRRGYSDFSNREGTFYFAGLPELASGRPFSYVRQVGDPRLTLWNHESAVFIQDEVKLSGKASLGAGLRYERQRWPGDGNNIAPRLGLALSPGKGGRTVLRTGVGVFYDHIGASAGRDVLRFDGRRLILNVVSNPAYPGAVAEDGGHWPPPSVVRFDPTIRSPYVFHYSFGLERQLARKSSMSVSYAGVRGARQFRSRDLNTPVGPGLGRPDASLGQVRQMESSARLAADSLLVSLRGDLTKWVQATARYRLGYARNDSAGVDAIPANSRDLSGEWSRADYDRRHQVDLMASIKAGRLFQLGLIAELESGRPYSLTTGGDDNGDGLARDRPAGVRRNTMQGPGNATLDLRWSRKFALGGDKSHRDLTLQMDAFNALNRVNYSGWVGNMNSPFFGRAVASRSARRVQLGARFEF
jgi:hypothetical protein